MSRLGIVSACLALSLAGCSDSTATVAEEPPGENCPRGGFRLESGGEVFYSCDRGPAMTATEEPPGDNCPTGGFRLEADGEVFYSCAESEEVSTEEVAAGTLGNPCVGDALLVTVPLTDGTTRDAYVCQPLVVDEASLAVLTLSVEPIRARLGVQCACLPEGDQAGCEASVRLLEAVTALIDRCAAEVISIVGPLPEIARPVVECLIDQADQATACFEAVGALACSAEIDAELQACVDAYDMANCPAPPPEMNEWTQQLGQVGNLVGCPIVLGAIGSPTEG
jgi:hypothetical protein